MSSSYRKVLTISILVVLLSTSLNTNLSSISTGSSLIYDFTASISYDYTEGNYWINFKLTAFGTVDMTIEDIDSNYVSLRFSLSIDKYDYTIDTNHPDKTIIESGARSFMEEYMSNFMKVDERITVPLNIFISPLPNAPYMRPLYSNLGVSVDISRLKSNYIDAKTIEYRGRPVLYTKIRLFSTIPVTINGEAEQYTDVTSGIIIEGRGSADISGYSDNLLIHSSINIELKLRNIDVLGNIVRKTYELRFGEGVGKICVSSRKLMLNRVEFKDDRVLLNISGSGLGIVFIELPGEVNVRNIYVDGSRVDYVSIEGAEAKHAIVPIALSTHTVEIRFDQRIESLNEVAERGPAGETSMLLQITLITILVVSLVVVAVIVLKTKR